MGASRLAAAELPRSRARAWRLRRLTAAATAHSLLVPSLLSVAAITTGATAIAALAAVSASPARAATTGPVLVLAQNGMTTAPEYTLLTSAGYSATQVTPAQWEAMSVAQFQGYAALVIGDPSSGSCSSLTPTTQTTGADALGTSWQAAVTGNISVLGTAPMLADTSGSNGLVTDSVGYAAEGYDSGAKTGTGLYVSLNCDYSTAAAGMAVSFLNGVENIGTGAGKAGALTLQGGMSCGDPGVVNNWEAESSGTFGSLASSQLSGSSWPSPSCPVHEAFDTWPANFDSVGYDASSDATANYTASDGESGQPYILLGTPPLSQATPAGLSTLSLALSTGGEVPALSTVGGTNSAAAGASQAIAGDGVNTENGDFSQVSDDTLIGGYGPALDFVRSYDSQLAQVQTRASSPGAMGYGWTDNWSTSLTTGKPAPGDIYAISGLGTDNGNGGPPSGVPLSSPGPVWWHDNTFFADTGNNRILEIPGTSGPQWGMPMTGGDVYQLAGSPLGDPGRSKDGTAMTNSLLDTPTGITLDSAGDLYIADSGNNRVLEVPASSGTQWGIPMTADHIYNVAGHSTGAPGHGGDGASAVNAFLSFPGGMAFDPVGDLYIADSGNNRVQEVFTSGGQHWSQSMAANDIYTVAGSTPGNAGDTSTNGTPAISALLDGPEGISFSSVGDMFIADTFNNRVIEVPQSSGTQWTIPMSPNDIYTVAGSPTGVAGSSADGVAATSAKLNLPEQVELDNGKQLYIADAGNNRIREVARTGHSEWNVTMAVNDIYTIAGTGVAGFSGDNGAALSAKLSSPQGFALDGTAEMYIADTGNNRMRVVSGSTFVISEFAGNGGSLLSVGDNGQALDAAYDEPSAITTDASGNLYIADENNNRVQEIAASNHSQFKITMTAGFVYTVAGNANGAAGISGDGGLATSARLNDPLDVAVDNSGDLYIADSANNRIQEVSATTGDISTVAGSATGVGGLTGDGGPATGVLLSDPTGVAVDNNGNVYVSDFFNNRVQEIAAQAGTQWGRVMAIGDMYTVAGSSSGVAGVSGDGGVVRSALLNEPADVAIDSAGDVYIADSGNNRVQEMYADGQSWAQQMTSGDMYTVSGSASGALGLSGDGGAATSGLLNDPVGVGVDTTGNLYIADSSNNRVQEVSVNNGIQWAQQMTANDVYTVVGDASGSDGDTGLGGPATSARVNDPEALALDAAGNLYIPDSTNDVIDEVTATTSSPFPESPDPTGVTLTQPDGSQVTFYQVGSGCAPGYEELASGQYCGAPQDIGVNLSATGTGYTYSPSAGTTYIFNSLGQLMSVTDSRGATLMLAYGTVPPGTGNCPVAANWCELITAANGRTETIGYNSSDLVSSVSDSLDQTWIYSYTGSSLTAVQDPMGNTTRYTYGQGSTGNPMLASDLLSITRPNAQPGGPDAGDSTINSYNSQGQVISQTDPSGSVTAFSYCVNAAASNCMNTSTGDGDVTVDEAEGVATVYHYHQGVVAAITRWDGNSPSESDYGPDTTSQSASSGGTLLNSWQSDPDRDISHYKYDQYGNTTSETDALGEVTTTWSTPGHAVTCSADALTASPCSQTETGPNPVAAGSTITPPSSAPPSGVNYVLYDNTGNALYSTYGVYPPGSNVASATVTDYTLYNSDSVTLGGNTITCASVAPAASLPCASIDAAGGVTQLQYDTHGDLISASAPDGNGSEVAEVSFTYDGDGQQTSTTTADGNLPGATKANFTTTTAYNADGQATAVTSAGGAGATVTPRTTSYGYDADGNQVSVTDPRGYATSTAFDADDVPTMVTDPDNNATLTCYDSDGNAAQTVPPAGVAANHLTPASCPTSYPAGYGDRLAADATTYTNNSLGLPATVTTPAPAGQTGYETTTYTYDSAGRQTEVAAPPTTNTAGAPDDVTRTSYEANGSVSSETTGYGTSDASTVSYCYDLDGDLTAVVAPDANTVSTAPCNTNPSDPYIVDPVGDPNQAAYQTTYKYDSAGDQVSTTTPATPSAPGGATTTSAYNSAGEIASVTDPNGVTTSYAYNVGDNLTTVSYSGGTAHSQAYTYDAEGNITGITDASGTSSYTFDPFGELASAINGAGHQVSYGYNADGSVATVGYPLPASATWASSDNVSYGYDHADQPTSVTDFNGNQTTITNTADGLPSSVALGATGDTINMTYDPAGGPLSVMLKNSTSTLLGFSYLDAPSADILSETDTPASSQSMSYAYNARGQIASMAVGTGPTRNYGFDASGNLATLPNGAAPAYDYAGQLTSASLGATSTSYSYDADGQQLSSKQGATTITSATWNGANEMTGYSDAAAIMTAATYDAGGLRQSDTIGGTTKNFTWDVSSQLLMDSANAYVYSAGTTPFEQVNLSTGAVSYLVNDSLGSIRGVVSSTGALTASTEYDAFGNPLASGGLTSYTPFGYAGAYTDPTGLLYLVNRYYDPTTGQFDSVDPDVDETGEPYGYAGGDPVSASDPQGLGWAIVLPWAQDENTSEKEFEKVLQPILGAQKAYRVKFEKRTDFRNREVDLYQSYWGWLNELKIGKQYYYEPKTLAKTTNYSEILRDRYMIAHGPRPAKNIVCHIVGSGCERFTVNGGNWWFRYDKRSACQKSFEPIDACPSTTLAEKIIDLDSNKVEMNMILLIKSNRHEDEYEYVYNHERTKFREAVQSYECPVESLRDELGMPDVKDFRDLGNHNPCEHGIG